MITINFERTLVEEIHISSIALNAMPKEVLAKVNDIVLKITKGKCRIDDLSCTSSSGLMEDPYCMVVKHATSEVIIKVYENKLITTV